MMLPKSLSKTHHEFCMETGNEFSRIHTCGKNGSAGIKEKTSHKPCTLCFKLSSSTFGKCHSPLKLFHFSSYLVTMWLRNTHIFLTTCQCTLPGKKTNGFPQSFYSSPGTHKYNPFTQRSRNTAATKKVLYTTLVFWVFYTKKKQEKQVAPRFDF